MVDDSTEVAALLGPVRLLDNTAIHIDDICASVRSVDHINGAEVRVSGTKKLRLLVRVRELSNTIFDMNLTTANEATYRLSNENVALDICWVIRAANDTLAAGGGEVVQVLSIWTEASLPTLDIRETNEGEDFTITWRIFFAMLEVTITNRRLEAVWA